MHELDDRFGQLVAPPVFIVAVPRSGTTWAGDIFSQHPQIAYVHESYLFSSALSRMFEEFHYPGTYSGLGFTIARGDLLNLSGELARRVWSRKIQPQHRYLVEKSPDQVICIPLMRECFPDAKFIMLVRDGRDVCVSVRAATKSWAPEWKNSIGPDVAHFAKYWAERTRIGLRDGAALGKDFLLMRYEDLHADPYGNYRKLFDFAGVPYDDALLKTIFAKTDFKSNYKGGEKDFRRQGGVGDWRRRLSPLEVWQFKREAGDLLLELGYATDRTWQGDYAGWFGDRVVKTPYRRLRKRVGASLRARGLIR